MFVGICGMRSLRVTVMSLILTSAAGALVAGETGDFEQLLAERGPAIVTVKYVLQLKSGRGEQEFETESTGVVIDPSGLVLGSNTQFGDVARLVGRGGDITATPTDIKVLIGEDTEGLDAKLLARDSELDLAWVRIEDLGDRKLTAVDFGTASAPKPGQRLVSLRRMGKYFDRTTVIGEGRVGGITDKPRRLYVPAGGLTGGLGIPVFTADGGIVGMTVLQLPDQEEMGGNPMAMRAQMQELSNGLILPAGEIAKATARAAVNDEEEE